MADKIVQLQDKQGNNVFPITGGMAADSITTDMIQDGAVTSEKVDFANYSLEEKIVGKWTDGKPVYEKTFVSTTFQPNNSYYQVATGVEQYISQEGYVHRKDYSDIWSRIPSRPSTTLSVAWGATSTNSGIQMEWGSGWGNDGGTYFDKIVLTVRYTKRSDYQ